MSKAAASQLTWTRTWLSSRVSKSSSAILMVYSSVPLCWTNWNSTLAQVSCRHRLIRHQS